jgi:hypothetical protein
VALARRLSAIDGRDGSPGRANASSVNYVVAVALAGVGWDAVAWDEPDRDEPDRDVSGWRCCSKRTWMRSRC